MRQNFYTSPVFMLFYAFPSGIKVPYLHRPAQVFVPGNEKLFRVIQAKNAVGILSQLCQTKKRRIPVAALQLLQMTINKIVFRQGGSKEKNITYKYIYLYVILFIIKSLLSPIPVIVICNYCHL